MFWAESEKILIEFAVILIAHQNRFHTQLRRTRPASMGERLSFGDIILDASEHRVFRAGQPLHLGPTEFRLLSTLMEKPGRVWTREQLLDRVWGRDIYVDTRTVDVHINHLRQHLRDSDVRIETLRGVGYKLTADPSPNGDA